MENRGLSYEQASRRGLDLVRTAADTQNWWAVVDDLVELRAQMRISPELHKAQANSQP